MYVAIKSPSPKQPLPPRVLIMPLWRSVQQREISRCHFSPTSDHDSFQKHLATCHWNKDTGCSDHFLKFIFFKSALPVYCYHFQQDIWCRTSLLMQNKQTPTRTAVFLRIPKPTNTTKLSPTQIELGQLNRIELTHYTKLLQTAKIKQFKIPPIPPPLFSEQERDYLTVARACHLFTPKRISPLPASSKYFRT